MNPTRLSQAKLTSGSHEPQLDVHDDLSRSLLAVTNHFLLSLLGYESQEWTFSRMILRGTQAAIHIPV